VLWACRRNGARFSVTVALDAKVRTAITAIPDGAWVAIKYPNAIWDDDEQRWISEAQIAEIAYTAFAGTRYEITARLIVRRVPCRDRQVDPGQAQLFATWRYHALFTDSTFVLVQAEAQHRGHAVIEQVLADFIDGPLAHLPSGDFAANGAWLTLAGVAHNLTRAAGHLAAPHYGVPAPPLSVASWSTSPPVWPAVPGRSSCTYLNAGPGRTPGTASSPLCTPHQPDCPQQTLVAVDATTVPWNSQPATGASRQRDRQGPR